MSDIRRDQLGAEAPVEAATAIRYASAPAWRAVDDYFMAALVPEDAALVAARESGIHTPMRKPDFAASQGALLVLLTQIATARRVLEFGTLAGYSTILFARAVGAEGQVITCELEESNAAIAWEDFERAGVAEHVIVTVGPAIESAQQLIDGDDPFDLVFINADKPSSPQYLAAALKRTRPGAFIVIDNLVRNEAVVSPNVEDPRVQGVRHVLDDISANPNLDATAVQTGGVNGWRPQRTCLAVSGLPLLRAARGHPGALRHLREGLVLRQAPVGESRSR